MVTNNLCVKVSDTKIIQCLNILLNALPSTILLTSLVPAPISYSLASLRNLPVGYSFMYPFPPALVKCG